MANLNDTIFRYINNLPLSPSSPSSIVTWYCTAVAGSVGLRPVLEFGPGDIWLMKFVGFTESWEASLCSRSS